MLAVPCKNGKGLDWSGPLRSYLSQNYSPEILDEHASSIQRLSTTREVIVGDNSTSTGASVEQLESYLKMLNHVQPRFPIGEGGLKLNFVWYDALNPKKKVAMGNIEYEKAAALFNLGAVLSKQGMVQDRSDANGLKKACGFFQQAAGIFEYLQDEIIDNAIIGPVTSDLSAEGLSMLKNLMLGQAQACFYEKAITAKMKAGVLAKLSAQAALYYEKAWDYSKMPVLNETLDSTWAAHLEFQYYCFSATGQFQYSKVIHEKAEETTVGYGEEIARLAIASDLCQSGINHGNRMKLPSVMMESVGHLRTVIDKTMDKVSEDNNSIYMERIPSKSSVSQVSGSSLSKCLPPDIALIESAIIKKNNEGVPSNADEIFGNLLPVAMQEAEILYQSKISAMMEQSGKDVVEAAENIKLQLNDANLPAAVEAGASNAGLPDKVWERMNLAVLSKGGISALNRGIDSNARLSEAMDSILNDIENQLQIEADEDEKLRQKWGNDKWTTTNSRDLNIHMQQDIDRYKQLVLEAKESDRILKDKTNASKIKMEMLAFSKSKLDSLFPTGEEIDKNPNVMKMQERLALQLITLGTLIQEIENTQSQFVDQVSKDSITYALSKAPGGAQAITSDSNTLDSFIAREASKYNPLILSINKNIEKLAPMLSRVLDDNHAFSAERNQSAEMKRREGIIASIYSAIDTFVEISTFIAEGEKFYMNLSGRIEMLKTTATDHVYVREIQRKELDLQLTQQQGSSSSAAPAPTARVTATTTRISSEPQQPMGGSYPGQVLMQPYAVGGGVAQAFPASPAIQPAYPIAPGGAAASPPPPPPYSRTVNSSSSNSNNNIQLMKATLGTGYTDKQLEEALAGADNDVNIAINHLLGSDPTPSEKRKSKKKTFGYF